MGRHSVLFVTIACCLASLGSAVPLSSTAALLGDDIQCGANAYPPPNNTSPPKFVINLDLPPQERWREVLTTQSAQIAELHKALVELIGGVFNGKILNLIDALGPMLGDTLPSPYKEELQGVANISGMPFGEVVLYNVFYEFFTVCTSVVAQNQNGEIIHARNMDFGLFLGWDHDKHVWSMTEILRKNVIELDWQKAGKTVFKSVNFGGYIGVLTAVYPGKVSLTIDERFNINGGFIGLLQWITGNRDLDWVGFTARDIFEKGLSYDDAKDTLIKAKLIAPVYFIMGGTEAGQGAIVTKDRNSDTADVLTMSGNSAKYADWYVLETNYDHWSTPPFFDDRRTSGNKCMLQTGKTGVTFEGIFNVLSTKPNFNMLTVYTALMNVKSGAMESYLRDCGPDCPPW